MHPARMRVVLFAALCFLTTAPLVDSSHMAGSCANSSILQTINSLPAMKIYIVADANGEWFYMEKTNLIGNDGFQRGDDLDPCSGPRPWDLLMFFNGPV